MYTVSHALVCGKGSGTGPVEFGVEDSNAKCPLDFVMPQSFKHQIACIIMQQKAYQPHNSESIITTSEKYVFNVYRITASGGKFYISLATARAKILLRIHQNAIYYK